MEIRYTLKEANQAMKLVRVIAGEMLERRDERRARATRRHQLESAAKPERMRDQLAELDARIWELDEALLTIQFPGRSAPGDRTATDAGEKLVFCWQEGEGRVGLGHPVGEEAHPRLPLRVAKGA
jgi:hypothetical protein